MTHQENYTFADELAEKERYFRRLLSRHRRSGDEGLVSGHRGKPSNHRMKESDRQGVVEIIGDPIYEGFGPTQIMEKLEEFKRIIISKETVRQIMIEEEKHHPKKKKIIIPHPQRERRACRGELVQVDGSYHAWLEERAAKACLLLFIDDATSEALAAKFVVHESYFAYGELCRSYFKGVGIPVAFYSDKFSVFRVNSNNVTHKDAVTQFSRAIGTFGIELICANSPQAKGRMERANQTFQNRLVKELRLLHINNYRRRMLTFPLLLIFTIESLLFSRVLWTMCIFLLTLLLIWILSFPAMILAPSQKTSRSSSIMSFIKS